MVFLRSGNSGSGPPCLSNGFACRSRWLPIAFAQRQGSAMPDIAIAKFSHEGNSFTPVATDLAAFRNRAWAIGETEARAVYGGTSNEIGGALSFLDARPHWSATFLRMATASPAGPLPRATFETILGDILAGLRARRFDAVYLALHGAMLVDDEPRADLEILRRVRGCIG